MDTNSTSRQNILNIAFGLFAAHGYNATSVRRIAQEADSNVSAIGYYFGGKEGLYREVINSRLKEFSRLLSQLVQKEDRIEKRIAHFSRALVEALSQSPSILQIITRELVSQNPEVPHLTGDIIKIFSGITDSLFENINYPRPQNIDSPDGIFSIFQMLAPVYFYFIVNTLVDKLILQSDKEILRFREKLISDVYEKCIAMLGMPPENIKQGD